MKMVLVFDTDDGEGMQTSMKIMKQVLHDYEHTTSPHDPKFGKIELIRMLKDYEAFTRVCSIQTDDKGVESMGLHDFKTFADYVFETKRRETVYKAKWKTTRR